MMLHKFILLSSLIIVSSCGDLKVEPIGTRTNADAGTQDFSGIDGIFARSANTSNSQSNTTLAAGESFYNPKVAYTLGDIQIEQYYFINTKDRKFGLITKCRFKNEDAAYISVASSGYRVSEQSENILNFEILSTASNDVKMNALEAHRSRDEICTSKFERTKFLLKNSGDCFIMQSTGGFYTTKIFPILDRGFIFDDEIRI